MPNEQEENMAFVQLIESHPCLYDVTSSNYTRHKRKSMERHFKKMNNSSK